jgi:hypothetical protein
VVCHCPAESQRNLNKIGVRSFILSGAPSIAESPSFLNNQQLQALHPAPGGMNWWDGLMRLLMGITKNRHGTYYAIKQVPKHLQAAVAHVLNNGKARQSWLKRSLRTKDGAQANRTAKPVLIEFDRIIAQAEALQIERPLRSELSQREIEQIANFFYAHELAADEENRREGGSEELFQAIAKQLDDACVEYDTPYAKGAVPTYGLSDREMAKIDQTIEIVLPAAQQALARGDIG